jgi:nitrogen fixation NifU-like protein
MKSTQYSEKVLDHFRKPRNVGTLEGENVYKGRVGNPVCGDLMEIYIKVKDNRIEDIKLQTFGCGSAIATASMITELAKGRTIDEADRITRKDVADELDGLPPVKMHCSNLAADALQDAIKNFREKQGKTSPGQEENQSLQSQVDGVKEFLNRGFFDRVDDYSFFQDKRVIISDNSSSSIEIAKKIKKNSPRVIYITSLKEHTVDPELKNEFKKLDIKLLYESEIIEVRGFKEVEKVVIHNLDEDEEYELFVDAVIIPK